MKKIEIILNGGLKGCCSSYSTSQLRESTKSWFEKMPEIEFVLLDITEDEWESDPISDLAFKYFGYIIFPLVFFNGMPVSMGKFPEKLNCLSIISDPRPIKKEDVESVYQNQLKQA